MECAICHRALLPEAAFCPACGTRQLDAPSYDDYDFAAFISYRHRSPDAEIACRVQHALESYRLPREVADRWGANRLGSVFLDKSELPATSSLPGSIKTALERSRCLIVVCTPETPKSTWVNSEIELFASLHGRERIFAVLAEGTSSESIPDLLKYRMAIDVDGLATSVPAEPLAADMRTRSKRQFSQEKLRLVAAIASVGFDELAQRQRRRTRLRTLSALAAIVCVVAVIVGLANVAVLNQQEAQISEAQRLVSESGALLAQGDRYGAIDAALEAMRVTESSAENGARNMAERNASRALKEALGIYSDPLAPWQAGYLLKTEHGMSLLGDVSMTHGPDALPDGAATIAFDDSDDLLAISDDAGVVTTYNMTTGRKLATCAMPDTAEASEHGYFVRNMVAANGQLFVSNPQGAGVLACFDAFTGELAWSRDVSAAALCLSRDGAVLDIACLGESGLTALAINPTSGAMLAATSFEVANLPEPKHGTAIASGETGDDFFVGVGDALFHVNLSASTQQVTQLARSELVSLSYENGRVLATSIAEYDGVNLELSYCIESFDSALGPTWSREGSVVSEMIDGELTTLVQGWPAVHGFTFGDNSAAVVSAGRCVSVISLESGDILFGYTFNGDVLDAQPVGDGGSDNPYGLFVMCTDGSIAMRYPQAEASNTSADYFQFNMGRQLRWGAFGFTDRALVALVLPANATNQVLCYQISAESGTGDREYTDDELVVLAQKTLNEVRT